MTYYPFPIESFERYVKAMPQSEAQAALLYLAYFLVERENKAIPCDLSPATEALMTRCVNCNDPD